MLAKRLGMPAGEKSTANLQTLCNIGYVAPDPVTERLPADRLKLFQCRSAIADGSKLTTNRAASHWCKLRDKAGLTATLSIPEDGACAWWTIVRVDSPVQSSPSRARFCSFSCFGRKGKGGARLGESRLLPRPACAEPSGPMANGSLRIPNASKAEIAQRRQGRMGRWRLRKHWRGCERDLGAIFDA